MWFNLLLIFVPVAFFLEFTHASGTLIFIASVPDMVDRAFRM